MSLCPPISKESNVGDGFIVPDHQFFAGDAKCDLRKEQVQTISSIRRRHEKGRIHRMPNRTTVLVPKRTKSHRSQRQPSRHFRRKMLPAAKPTSRLAFHLPLSRLATELQQVTFSFRCRYFLLSLYLYITQSVISGIPCIFFAEMNVNRLERFSFECCRNEIGFPIPPDMIGLRNSRHFFIQLENRNQ